MRIQVYGLLIALQLKIGHNNFNKEILMETKSFSHIPFFTKPELLKANLLAINRGYNRTLSPELLAELPEDFIFPVSFSMIHEHAAGNSVDPHMRCIIITGHNCKGVFLDCDMSIFKQIKERTKDEAKA
jgi:hypothetical protein